MSGPTVRFKVRFGQKPVLPPTRPTDGDAAEHEPGPEAILPDGHAGRTAHFLAIAHRMESLLRDGRLRDYDHAAAWLGVSKERANVLSRLIFLAPDIQETILLGDTAATEHRLREIAREPIWAKQRRRLETGL